MNRDFAAACHIARKDAGLTQNRAAGIFGVSDRTMAYYESGAHVPTDRLVADMVIEYRAPWLGYKYLSEVLCTRRLLFPRVAQRSLSSNALRLGIEMMQMQRKMEKLQSIAWDDVVEPSERTAFRDCMVQIENLLAACIGIGIQKGLVTEVREAIENPHAPHSAQGSSKIY